LNATSLARLLLALAYPWLAHLASHRHDGTLAAIALGDLAVIVLLESLVRRRPVAWLALAVIAVGLVALARSPHAVLPLLLVPAVIVALVAWTFGRTLFKHRTPLITRMVSLIDHIAVRDLTPDLMRYTRQLTATWALVLGVLALVDLALALCAVPGGVLDSVGIVPPVAVSNDTWSWVANGLIYGLVGGLFVGEYFFRIRRFPGRDASFFDFLRKMAGIGPAAWRGLLRDDHDGHPRA
jgi:uncharacterized membrane protein